MEAVRVDGNRDLFLEGRETSGDVLWETAKARFLPEKTQESWAGPRAAPPGVRRRVVMAERTRAVSSEPFDTMKCP